MLTKTIQKGARSFFEEAFQRIPNCDAQFAEGRYSFYAPSLKRDFKASEWRKVVRPGFCMRLRFSWRGLRGETFLPRLVFEGTWKLGKQRYAEEWAFAGAFRF